MPNETTADTVSKLRDIASRAAEIEAATSTQLSAIRYADRTAYTPRTDRQKAERKKYELGGVLTGHGFAEVDPYALAGLFRNASTFAEWLGVCAEHLGTDDVAACVNFILKRPGALAWLREWGHDSEFRKRAEQYREGVAKFDLLDAESSKRWRAKGVTKDQWAIAGHISEADGVPLPTFKNRGAAHDWIRSRDGDTRYRIDRPLPPSWEEWKRNFEGIRPSV
jgi:hypothetical protein